MRIVALILKGTKTDEKEEEQKNHVSGVRGHLSCVMCRMSPVTNVNAQQPHPQNLHLLTPPVCTVDLFATTQKLGSREGFQEDTQTTQ